MRVPVLLPMLALIVGLVLLVVTVSRSDSDETNPTHAKSGIVMNEVMCGPDSLSVAAAKVGIELDPKAIARECQLTSRGVSLLDLRRAAEKFSLKAEGVNLTWEQLMQLQTPAVLYLSGNHFAAVDPRETGLRAGQTTIALYDPPAPAKWITQTELAAKWQGHALIVSPRARSKADLAFETLLLDFGAAYSGEVVTKQFSFVNHSKKPIQVLELRKTCGCTSAEISTNEIGPAERGTVSITIDMNGRQGDQHQSVYLVTDNQRQPIIPLTLQGHVINPVHISEEVLDLGVVTAGQRIRKSVVITDRNRGTLEIDRCAVVDESSIGEPLKLVASKWGETELTMDEIWLKEQGIDFAVPVRRGLGSRMLLVELEFEAPSKAVTATYSAQVTLTTHDSAIGPLRLPITYTFMNGYISIPPKLAMTSTHELQRNSHTILLKKAGEHPEPIQIKNVEVSGDATGLLSIEPVETAASTETVIRIGVDHALAESSNQFGLLAGKINIRMQDETLVEVPWTYYHSTTSQIE